MDASLLSLLRSAGCSDRGAEAVVERERETIQKCEVIETPVANFYFRTDSFDEQFFPWSVAKILAIADICLSAPLEKKEAFRLALTAIPHQYVVVRLSQQDFGWIQAAIANMALPLDTTIDMIAVPLESGETDKSIRLAKKKDIEQILECAASFSQGRLFMEPEFHDGGKLYRQWLMNSINKEVADAVYIMENQQRLQAVATVRRHQVADITYWEVPLIAKHVQSKEAGVASRLLRYLRLQAKKESIDFLQVSTHGSNIPAIRSYSRAGFSVYDAGMTLRFLRK